MNKKNLLITIIILSILLAITTTTLVTNIYQITNTSKKETKTNNKEQTDVIEKENKNDEILDTSENINEIEVNDSNIEEDYIINNNDKLVLAEINNINSDIKNTLTEDLSLGLVKVKEGFIILVDFIFYEGVIKDKTFKTLSDETKQEILNTVDDLDSFVMNYYPNYKEEILNLSESASNTIFSAIEKGKNNISEYAINNIDPEILLAIKKETDDLNKAIDEVINSPIITKGKEDIINKYKETTSNLDSWYQEFKKD